MRKIFPLFVFLLLCSCNSGEPNATATAPTDSDTAVLVDSATLGGSVAMDSAKSPIEVPDDPVRSFPAENENKPVDATLGFSYYPVIPQNETRDLRVFVMVQGKPSAVRQSIRQIEQEDLEFTKIKTAA